MNYILILVAVIIIFFMLKNKKSGGIKDGKYKFPSELEQAMKELGAQTYTYVFVISNNTLRIEINGVPDLNKIGIISKSDKKAIIDGVEKELYKVVDQDGAIEYIANNKSGDLLLYSENPFTKELQNVVALVPV